MLSNNILTSNMYYLTPPSLRPGLEVLQTLHLVRFAQFTLPHLKHSLKIGLISDNSLIVQYKTMYFTSISLKNVNGQLTIGLIENRFHIRLQKGHLPCEVY